MYSELYCIIMMVVSLILNHAYIQISMSVLLDCTIVMRMLCVTTLKEVLTVRVSLHSLVMEERVKVSPLKNMIVCYINYILSNF